MLRACPKIREGHVADDFGAGQGDEEGAYPQRFAVLAPARTPFGLPLRGRLSRPAPAGSVVTDEQRRPAPKAAQPGGREEIRASGGVARSLQTAAGMLVARALPYALISSRMAFPNF